MNEILTGKTSNSDITKFSFVWCALMLAGFSFSLFFNGIHIQYLSLAYACFLTVLGGQFVLFLKDKQVFDYKSLFLLLVISLWMLCVVNLFTTTLLYNSYIYFWKFSLFPIVFLMLALQKDERILNILLLGVFLVMSVVALSAVFQFFAYSEYYKYRGVGSFLNPNTLAGAINVCLIPAALFFMTASDKAKAWFWYVISLCLIFGLCVTISRGGVYGALISLGFAFIVLRRHEGFCKKKLLIFIGTAVIIYLFTNIYYFSFRDVEMLNSIDSFGMRLRIWSQAYEMFLDSPFFGFGYSTFALYYPQYRLENELSAGHYAHNDPLQFAIEMGILAPILFYLILIAGAARTYKAMKNLESGSRQGIVIIAFFSGILALIIHTHVTFHLYSLPCLLLLAIIIGLWYRETGKALGKGVVSIDLPRKYKWASGLGMAVFFMIALHGSMVMVVSEHFYKKAESALQTNDYDVFAENINIGSAITLGMDIKPLLLYANWQIGVLQNSRGSIEERRQVYLEAENALNKAEKMHPQTPLVPYYKALLYFHAARNIDLGLNNKSREAIERALFLNSRFKPAEDFLNQNFRASNR